MQQNDSDLFSQYCQGSEEAFQQIYARFGRRVYGYIFKKINNEQIARDLLQEVFLKLHRLRHRYDPQYPLGAWVFLITRSLLTDYFRRHKHSDLPIEDIDESHYAATEAETGHELNIDLDSLTESERSLIERRFFSGLSYKELEKIFETPSTTLRKRVERILVKLRKQLKRTKT